MIRLLFAIVVSSCLLSCASSKQVSPVLPQEKLVNVSYGSFSSSVMDVYLPANRNNQTPFVLLIHGGAWVMGQKEWETATQDSLLAHGVASANINYRFANDSGIHYQQLLADVDSALAYCIGQAATWHTRLTSFVTAGTSAGAHMSLLYAYTTTKKINAVVAFCPPTDLTDTAVLNYEKSIGILPAIEKMTGANYTVGKPLPAAFTASSPLYRVKAVPTLLFHGTTDRTVPYTQSNRLQQKLQAKKVTHLLITLPGADHDLDFSKSITRSMVYKEMIAWVLKYGK